jgi:hypothetical protein
MLEGLIVEPKELREFFGTMLQEFMIKTQLISLEQAENFKTRLEAKKI